MSIETTEPEDGALDDVFGSAIERRGDPAFIVGEGGA